MLLRDKHQARSGSPSKASPIIARTPDDRRQGYPTIDLFAGPGGLGEGFASALDGRAQNRFQSVVSIEREEFSHKTLLLRHFFRHFPRGEAPDDYYDFTPADYAALLASKPKEGQCSSDTSHCALSFVEFLLF